MTHWLPRPGLCKCLTMPIVGLLTIAIGTASADVIVLANRTGRPLPLRFTPVAGQTQQLNLPNNDVVPLFLDGKARVEFASAGAAKRYLLDANCAYYFGMNASGQVDMQKIGLGEDGTAAQGRSLPGSAIAKSTYKIPVKILVDEEEPGRQLLWERRLRRRIETASAIFQKYCGIGLEVVAVGTWNSDNDTNDLNASLSEFEREVPPSPARLAIGFSSQYQMVKGRTHMAGTRGPLHSHILVREGSPQISEPEKLEFLVHELGHHLGASHSPERTSVMRPVLGDNMAGRSDFRIQFDPVNALTVAMIGEEMRRRNVRQVGDLLPVTRRRLRQIYTQLAGSLPDDPTGLRYVQLINTPGGLQPVAAARKVLQAIVQAAIANSALPPASSGTSNGLTNTPSKRTGDALTDYYVRRAALAADTLPEEVGPGAFLLALAIGLDDSPTLANYPVAAEIAAAVEPPSERSARLIVLGGPTVQSRRDLTRQFFVGAYLTAAMGTQEALAAGLTSEIADAHDLSGFSFADIAAERAGSRFAGGVLNNRFSLRALSQSFSVAALMPDVAGLPETLSAAQVKKQFGAKSDPRFVAQLEEIDRRIQGLPPYRPSQFRLEP